MPLKNVRIDLDIQRNFFLLIYECITVAGLIKIRIWIEKHS